MPPARFSRSFCANDPDPSVFSCRHFRFSQGNELMWSPNCELLLETSTAATACQKRRRPLGCFPAHFVGGTYASTPKGRAHHLPRVADPVRLSTRFNQIQMN